MNIKSHSLGGHHFSPPAHVCNLQGSCVGRLSNLSLFSLLYCSVLSDLISQLTGLIASPSARPGGLTLHCLAFICASQLGGHEAVDGVHRLKQKERHP